MVPPHSANVTFQATDISTGQKSTVADHFIPNGS
jgi:hypothetical protein